MSIETEIRTEKVKVWVCDFCGHRFKSLQRLSTHVLRYHAGEFHADQWEYLVTRKSGLTTVLQVTNRYLSEDTRPSLLVRCCSGGFGGVDSIGAKDIPSVYVRTHVCGEDRLQLVLLDVMRRRLPDIPCTERSVRMTGGSELSGFRFSRLEVQVDASRLLRLWGEEVLALEAESQGQESDRVGGDEEA